MGTGTGDRGEPRSFSSKSRGSPLTYTLVLSANRLCCCCCCCWTCCCSVGGAAVLDIMAATRLDVGAPAKSPTAADPTPVACQAKRIAVRPSIVGTWSWRRTNAPGRLGALPNRCALLPPLLLLGACGGGFNRPASFLQSSFHAPIRVVRQRTHTSGKRRTKVLAHTAGYTTCDHTYECNPCFWPTRVPIVP